MGVSGLLKEAVLQLCPRFTYWIGILEAAGKKQHLGGTAYSFTNTFKLLQFPLYYSFHRDSNSYKVLCEQILTDITT